MTSAHGHLTAFYSFFQDQLGHYYLRELFPDPSPNLISLLSFLLPHTDQQFEQYVPG